MAWPFDRLTTYIANQVPVIKAFDLNALQDYIGHWIKGSKTVVAVEADGAGDQPVSAGPGEIHAAGNVAANLSVIAYSGLARSSATPGVGQAVPLGTIYKDTTIIGWAISNGTTLTRGTNILSFTRDSAGTYFITLNHQPAAALGGIATVQLAGYKLVANVGWDPFNNRWFVVTTDGGAYVDMPFAVIFLGGG
jgi:hypothetical protein